MWQVCALTHYYNTLLINSALTLIILLLKFKINFLLLKCSVLL